VARPVKAGLVVKGLARPKPAPSAVSHAGNATACFARCWGNGSPRQVCARAFIATLVVRLFAASTYSSCSHRAERTALKAAMARARTHPTP
jgi:hypothetical protein